MKVFDLKTMPASPWKQRDKNIFWEGNGFKARIIELSPKSAFPSCNMKQNVLFIVVQGSVDISANGKTTQAQEGYCVVTQPAVVSMKTSDGARVMAVQIDNPVQSTGRDGK